MGATPERPVPVFRHRRPAANALAERRPGSGLGHPEHRAFHVRPAVERDQPAHQWPGNGRAELFTWRDYGVQVGIGG